MASEKKQPQYLSRLVSFLLEINTIVNKKSDDHQLQAYKGMGMR